MNKIKLNLIGLHCAHCASIIEEKVSKMDTVLECSLDFITKELKIVLKNKVNQKEEIKKISKLISSIEPDVVIEDNLNTHKKEEHKQVSGNKEKLIRIILGIIVFAIAIKTDIFIIFFIAYLLFGYDILLKAIKNILKGQMLDENFLMSIATIGAFIIHEYSEAVAVMLFYQIGEYFQERAIGKSRTAIKSLINIKAEYAVKENGEKVAPEEISVGETIIVKAGEKVALDGEVIEGSSFLDMSALIGESMPRKVTIGDEVLSGSINNNSIIKIKVTKEYSNSTVAKILDLIENTSSKKSKTESFITKFAKIYTPIIVFIALFLMIVPPLFTGFNFLPWIEKSLVFLVSSCPCALVISVPLSFFSGIGYASKRGILIKGSMYMQNLNEVDTIVFDKTGTLTKGVFQINEINNINVDEKELIKTAYSLERFSTHPIAKYICRYYDENIAEEISNQIYDFEEISGLGLKGTFNNSEILVGNDKLLQKYNIEFQKSSIQGTIIYIAKDRRYLGNIIISDVIKDTAKETIEKLKEIGIKTTVMLSGDRKNTAEYVGKEIGIDEVYSELLPQDKVYNFQNIADNAKGKVAFVGDGINDAPVLSIADVGFSMGGIGSEATIEASSIVIMDDNLKKIYESIIISRNTIRKIKENIIFSLVVKFAVLGFALIGFTSIWLAVLADVGVSLIAILNAMKKKISI